MNVWEEIEYKGCTIKLVYDEDAESPREWDNLGTMICGHTRYNLGDEQDVSQEELEEITQRKDVLFLPLYMYEHGGIAIRTNAELFRAIDTAGWDWGYLGIIYVTYDKLREEYGKKRITKKTLEQAAKVLQGEVEVYDAYLQGGAFGYICEDEEGNVLDSCWGYYYTGEDEKEYVLSQAREAIDSYLEQAAVQPNL